MILYVVFITLTSIIIGADLHPHSRHRASRQQHYNPNQPVANLQQNQFENQYQNSRNYSPLPYNMSMQPGLLLSTQVDTSSQSHITDSNSLFAPVNQPSESYMPNSEPSPKIYPGSSSAKQTRKRTSKESRRLKGGSNTNKTHLKHTRAQHKIYSTNNQISELLEAGKELLEMSTVDSIETFTETFNNSDSSGEISNLTLIPIPKGVEMKSVSKNDGKEVDSDVNITRSTQRTLLADNSTEVENSVEMQVEKETKDRKGNNEGLEEIRIFETERIKPVHRRKIKSNLNRKKRRHHLTSVLKSQHRIKRSKIPRNEYLILTRRERIANPIHIPTQEGSLYSGLNKGGEYQNGEIDESERKSSFVKDFFKFVVREISKLKQSQNEESIKSIEPRNLSKHLYKTSRSDADIYKNPDSLKMMMNLNMTWKAESKGVQKDRQDRKKITSTEYPRTSDVSSPTTPVAPFMVFLKSNSVDESGYFNYVLIALLFSLFGAALWILYSDPHRIKSIPRSRNSAVRTYRFFLNGQNDKVLGLESYESDVEYDDTPKLEWQLEDGDWLE